MDNCSKAYLRITRTTHGCTITPADIAAFGKAQGVGARLEPDLSPMPNEVSITSLAVSMARIADSLEMLERVAVSAYAKRYKRRKWKFWGGKDET